MSQLVAALMIAVSTVSASTAHDRMVDRTQPQISACSLLTRELAAKVTTAVNKAVLNFPPQEQPIGLKGSSCEYAGIGLQIDPFAQPEETRKSLQKEWQPVSGVGVTALFRDNGGRFAELFVLNGTHHFTIQMGVPTGGTAEKVKPNTIELAHAIIAKLK